MNPKILKTERDYKAALGQLHELMHAKPGTYKVDRLELWATLIEDYEKHQYPIEPPDSVM